jgi:hypothetical protein
LFEGYRVRSIFETVDYRNIYSSLKHLQRCYPKIEHLTIR